MTTTNTDTADSSRSGRTSWFRWLAGLLIALILAGIGVLAWFFLYQQDDVESRVLALTKVTTEQADQEVQERVAEYKDRIIADPTDADAVGELGIVFELHGFSEEALLAYELATISDPATFKWPYYHGILLAARFDLEQAIERIDQALVLEPTYGPAHIQKGKLLLDNSQFSTALASFQEAEALSDDPYVFVGQALAYLGLNEPANALSALERTGSFAQHPNVRRLRGTALIRVGQREEGTRLLADLPEAPQLRWQDPVAEEKSPHAVDHFMPRLSRAVRLMRTRSYESALFILSELRTEYPTNKHVLHLLGNTYELMGDQAEALEVLAEGIELHPDFYVLRTSSASLLRSIGQNEEAKRQLDFAIDIDPKLHWAYSQKAQILMAERKWLEASHLLDQAISLNHDDPDLYTYLGICLGFLDRWPEAANLYRVAISLDARHLPSYINLARAETILNNEDEALAAIESARENGATPSMLASLERQRQQIKNMRINRVQH